MRCCRKHDVVAKARDLPKRFSQVMSTFDMHAAAAAEEEAEGAATSGIFAHGEGTRHDETHVW